ncbi:MAG TPA: bifunctional phosphoglucose/phosphomannose isomerase [Balneolaceae bacterium]|nr:bifunctional phosphoglucose/phosphomannose isomerase [Balneolaceae bacterium]
MSKLTKSTINSLDSGDMEKLLKQFSRQWKDAVKRTESLSLNINVDRIKNICMVGMGGSAIGADLIRAYSYDFCPLPVQVFRHYNIPEWVGKNTLFVGCSFSGTTEETLSAVSKARKRGAQLIAVTSGGELLVQASKNDFDYIKFPGGMPPRAALASSFVPLFRIFEYLGLIDEGAEALEETGEFLQQQGQLLEDTEDNEALALAEDLVDTLPIIYSDATIMEPVNLRWRTQMEENAKTLAYGNTLPEMNHNEIVGWDQIAHLTGRLSVVILRDKDDVPPVKQRMQIVEELIADQVSSINVFNTRGNSRLTRMFSLIQLADWTSFYLAMLNGVDPTPIAKIDLLKRRLSEL